MTEYSSAFCPTCDRNFGIVVSDDNEVFVACDCEIMPIAEFIEDLQDQLPLPYIEEDSDEPRGFQ